MCSRREGQEGRGDGSVFGQALAPSCCSGSYLLPPNTLPCLPIRVPSTESEGSSGLKLPPRAWYTAGASKHLLKQVTWIQPPRNVFEPKEEVVHSKSRRLLSSEFRTGSSLPALSRKGRNHLSCMWPPCSVPILLSSPICSSGPRTYSQTTALPQPRGSQQDRALQSPAWAAQWWETLVISLFFPAKSRTSVL